MTYLDIEQLAYSIILKPCPFCGGQAVIEKRRNVEHAMTVDTYYSAVCSNNGCRASINYMGEDDPISKVIELWNRRNYD